MSQVRTAICFFTLLSLACVEGFTQQPVTDGSIICWCEKLKLTWNDFQGKADTSEVFKDMLAATSASIRTFYFDDGGLPNYRISHFFQKSVSWSRDTSSLLLSHEQLHFDISELYARKIRVEIESLRKKKIKDVTKYVDAINGGFAERAKMQAQYDKDSHYGAIDFLQEEWNKKIKKELDLLKKYATKPADCKGSS